MVKNLLGKANIEGYFTNHSLRWTDGSILFQAGVERKIVKEVTVHASDAIDSYQITSDKQKELCSKVLACKENPEITNQKFQAKEICQESDSFELESDNVVDGNIPVVSSVTYNGKTACSCSKTYTSQSNNLGEMINGIIQGNHRGKKTIVKIQIEIDDE